jgi:hypothetical protein
VDECSWHRNLEFQGWHRNDGPILKERRKPMYAKKTAKKAAKKVAKKAAKKVAKKMK